MIATAVTVDVLLVVASQSYGAGDRAGVISWAITAAIVMSIVGVSILSSCIMTMIAAFSPRHKSMLDGWGCLLVHRMRTAARKDMRMQVPVFLALFYGGSIAMHVFKQDAAVSAVSCCLAWFLCVSHRALCDTRLLPHCHACL